LSKQFTASAIMLLVQEGKVGLEDKIGKYLDSAPDAWKEITLRHLLTHTSGLQREGQTTTARGERGDYSDEELMQSARALPLLSPPGEKYSYSNLGFNLLGMVVARVSGKPLAVFLQERLFQPLGMKATRINDLHDIILHRASAYQWAGGTLSGSDFVSPSRYSGSGAIVSTVLDLAKWDAALNTGFPLTAASRQQMWTPMLLNNGKPSAYGFGWGLTPFKGHTDISHDGVINGFHSEIDRFVDDRVTIIVLTNQVGLSNPAQIAHVVARDYIPALRSEQPKIVRINPASLPAYTGRYEYRNNSLLTFTAGKGKLLGQLPGGTLDDYLPVSPLGFWQADTEDRITFVKNAAGEVVKALRRRVKRIRGLLQKRGTKSAKRHLKKIQRKQSRFVRDMNHVVSKSLVCTASLSRKAIALEDLSGIRERVSVSREMRWLLGNWSFSELRQFIEYKAEAAGLPVVTVDPRNTSCTCSTCGYCDKANRKSQSVFKCLQCGLELNADWNAALNIKARGELSDALLCRKVASASNQAQAPCL
jgi:IS605 OrfB family transposase